MRPYIYTYKYVLKHVLRVQKPFLDLTLWLLTGGWKDTKSHSYVRGLTRVSIGGRAGRDRHHRRTALRLGWKSSLATDACAFSALTFRPADHTKNAVLCTDDRITPQTFEELRRSRIVVVVESYTAMLLYQPRVLCIIYVYSF